MDELHCLYWFIHIHFLLIYFLGASCLQLVMEQDAERQRLISHASSLKSALIRIMSSIPSSMKQEHHSIQSPQRHELSFLAWTPIISVPVCCGLFFYFYFSLLISFPFLLSLCSCLYYSVICHIVWNYE